MTSRVCCEQRRDVRTDEAHSFGGSDDDRRLLSGDDDHVGLVDVDADERERALEDRDRLEDRVQQASTDFAR